MTPPQLGALVISLTVGCGYWQSSPVGMDTAPQVWAATPSLRNGERQALGRQGQASIDSATGPSIEERLRNLQDLRKEGLIPDREYRERRQKLLDQGL